jgi:hypothetical protein
MKSVIRCGLTALLLSGAVHTLRADDAGDSGFWRQISTFHTSDGGVRIKLSGLLDLEAYSVPSTAPGLIFTNDALLFNPRLSLFVDGQLGSRVYFFTQTRLDRGFDPSEGGPELRMDEYALRFTPWDDGRFNFQIGKFATVTGNFSERHLSWDNPFINAPLVYENLTGIWDYWAPEDAGELLEWGHVPTPEYSSFGDGYYDKDLRVPVIWGPSYASGVSIAGRIRKFEYAAEVKNSALSSRPSSWDVREIDFDHPVFSGRFGFRPGMAWNLGFSASTGPYMHPDAADALPPGDDIGDYRQITFGHDVSFQWHHWQLWGEVYWSRFEVPAVGDADTVAYYLEAKYKFTPQFYGAVRWNQQFFSDIDYAGGQMPWGRDIWRLDTALGYRFSPHTQLKIQYGLQSEDWSNEEFEHLIATQFTAKF